MIVLFLAVVFVFVYMSGNDFINKDLLSDSTAIIPEVETTTATTPYTEPYTTTYTAPYTYPSVAEDSTYTTETAGIAQTATFPSTDQLEVTSAEQTDTETIEMIEYSECDVDYNEAVNIIDTLLIRQHDEGMIMLEIDGQILQRCRTLMGI